MDIYYKWQIMKSCWHNQVFDVKHLDGKFLKPKELFEKLKSLTQNEVKKEGRGYNSVFSIQMDNDYKFEASYTTYQNEKVIDLKLSINWEYIGWEKNAFSFYSKTPSNFIEYFFANFDEMKEKSNNAVLEVLKKRKIEQILYFSVESVVKEYIGNSGYVYNIIEGNGKKQYFLEVEISNNRKVRVMLSKTDFVKQIIGVKEFINSINKIENDSDIKIRVLNCGKRQEWSSKK